MSQLTVSMFLHYLWYFFQLLIQNGAIVSLTNKYGETPLDKVKEGLEDKLKGEGILEL